MKNENELCYTKLKHVSFVQSVDLVRCTFLWTCSDEIEYISSDCFICLSFSYLTFILFLSYIFCCSSEVLYFLSHNKSVLTTGLMGTLSFVVKICCGGGGDGGVPDLLPPACRLNGIENFRRNSDFSGVVDCVDVDEALLPVPLWFLNISEWVDPATSFTLLLSFSFSLDWISSLFCKRRSVYVQYK